MSASIDAEQVTRKAIEHAVFAAIQHYGQERVIAHLGYSDRSELDEAMPRMYQCERVELMRKLESIEPAAPQDTERPTWAQLRTDRRLRNCPLSERIAKAEDFVLDNMRNDVAIDMFAQIRIASERPRHGPAWYADILDVWMRTFQASYTAGQADVVATRTVIHEILSDGSVGGTCGQPTPPPCAQRAG